MAKYVFSHPRTGYGYEPGDEVTEEFARAHPLYAREVPVEKPVLAPKSTKQEDED